MTAYVPGRAARFPLRAAAAVLAAFAAVLLTLGFTPGAAPASAVAAGPAYFPASPGTPTYSSGTQPRSDEAYVAARTVLARPERDAGEREQRPDAGGTFHRCLQQGTRARRRARGK